MIKKRDFFHKNIKYSFNWNYLHHQSKLKNENLETISFKKMASFFKKICDDSIVPESLFNSTKFPRVSQFKIRGLKRAFMTSLSKKLIRSEKIIPMNSDSKLCNYTTNVYETFKENGILRKPGHDAVLKNILIKDPDSLAIEVPIWKKVKGTYITGHIDLVQIQDNTLKIIDYKPEGRFLYSLPQVATYGLLIKDIFGIDNLKCISFNKSKAWEYDPDILIKDIRDYLISQGITDRLWEEFF